MPGYRAFEKAKVSKGRNPRAIWTIKKDKYGFSICWEYVDGSPSYQTGPFQTEIFARDHAEHSWKSSQLDFGAKYHDPATRRMHQEEGQTLDPWDDNDLEVWFDDTPHTSAEKTFDQEWQDGISRFLK